MSAAALRWLQAPSPSPLGFSSMVRIGRRARVWTFTPGFILRSGDAGFCKPNPGTSVVEPLCEQNSQCVRFDGGRTCIAGADLSWLHFPNNPARARKSACGAWAYPVDDGWINGNTSGPHGRACRLIYVVRGLFSQVRCNRRVTAHIRYSGLDCRQKERSQHDNEQHFGCNVRNRQDSDSRRHACRRTGAGGRRAEGQT